MGLFDSALIIKSASLLLEVDVSKSETYTQTKTVTAHPVEKGYTVGDHVILQPRIVSIEGIVSDTPIGLSGLKKTATARANNLFNGKKMTNYVQDAYAALTLMYQNQESVTLITGLTQIPEAPSIYDLVISNLTINRSSETTGGLFFSATFTEIHKVNNKELQTSIANTSPGINADKKVDQGKQKTKEVSWLSQLRSLVGKIGG